jgi:hypothetical protein
MQNLNQLINQYEALRDQLRILGYAKEKKDWIIDKQKKTERNRKRQKDRKTEQMQNLNQLMNQYEALRDQLRILRYA